MRPSDQDRYRPGSVLLPQAPALAWNAVGHMAIARVAYGEMDRDVQARLRMAKRWLESCA